VRTPVNTVKEKEVRDFYDQFNKVGPSRMTHRNGTPYTQDEIDAKVREYEVAEREGRIVA